MPKLSEKRRAAIYNAVSEPLMALRVKLRMSGESTESIDRKIYDAMNTACEDAIVAAEGVRAESTQK